MSNEGGPKGPRIPVGDGSIPETTCDDHYDNDFDIIDCEDPDFQDDLDTFDNDGDGVFDCTDEDCFEPSSQDPDALIQNTSLLLEQCTQLEPRCAPAPVGDNCQTGFPGSECEYGKTDEPSCKPTDLDKLRKFHEQLYEERYEKLLAKGIGNLTDGEYSQLIEFLRDSGLLNNGIGETDCESPACSSDVGSTNEDPDNK